MLRISKKIIVLYALFLIAVWHNPFIHATEVAVQSAAHNKEKAQQSVNSWNVATAICGAGLVALAVWNRVLSERIEFVNKTVNKNKESIDIIRSFTIEYGAFVQTGLQKECDFIRRRLEVQEMALRALASQLHAALPS